MSRLKKTVLISVGIILLFIVLLIVFISPLAKYLVEKYDDQFLGRKITLKEVYVNPFTGYIYFRDVKIYEAKSDSIFLSVSSLSANFAMHKLLFRTYEISELVLDKPKGIVLQLGNKRDLNFNDIIKKFKPKKKGVHKESVKFNILSFRIVDGEFYYRENVMPINYYIKKVNINSSGLRWDQDTIGINFSFFSGTAKGSMKGNFTINTKNLDYKLTVKANKYDLDIIGQYLKDLTNYGTFSSNLDAEIHSSGNFKDNSKLTNSGIIALNSFRFGKSITENYASFTKLVVAIKEVTPGKFIYSFDSVSLLQPYLKYERYDFLDNVQMVFGKKGSRISGVEEDNKKFNLVIEIGHYIKKMSRNFFKSQYKLKRIAIYDGNLKFSDFSKSEKFSVRLSPFSISADSISKEYKLVHANLTGQLKPYGDINVKLSINPNDSSDFDLWYHLQKIPLATFNPYIISLTGFPLNRGTVELNGMWHVRNSNITSTNRLLVIDPRVGNRIINEDTDWLPIRFIQFFIREQGNVIDYDVPITGNLKSPEFKFRDVILDALENTFVKPLTTPYRITVKNTELEIENSLALSWEMNDAKLDKNQARFLKKTASYLEKNKEAKIIVTALRYEEKEKEYILLFEAKKEYYLTLKSIKAEKLSRSDTLAIQRLSIRDSLFVKYLNKRTKSDFLYTAQAKSLELINQQTIQSKFNLLNKQRLNAFIYYFKEKGVEKQIKFQEGINIVPYNGFSMYKINYEGNLPESIMNAYRRMNELNNEAPRNKFKKDRIKSAAKTKY